MKLIEINSCLGITIGDNKLIIHSHKAPCIEALVKQGYTLSKVPLSLYSVTESSEEHIRLRFSGVMCLCDMELIQEYNRITVKYTANAEQLIISLCIPHEAILYFDSYAINGSCFIKAKNDISVKIKSFFNKINNNGTDNVYLKELPTELSFSNGSRLILGNEPLSIDAENDKCISIRTKTANETIIIDHIDQE